MSSVSPNQQPYSFDVAVERALVTVLCSDRRLFARLGHHIDPELLKNKYARLAMKAARAIHQDTGRGPATSMLVIQRLRAWMNDGKVKLEEIKLVCELFDAAEDAGLPDAESLHAEVAPIFALRLRDQATVLTIEAMGQKTDLSKMVDLEDEAVRVLLPLGIDETVDDAPSWPGPMAHEAFHGLAGDIVRAIEPHTEGDPAGLLVMVLTMFGSAVGPDPHFMVEATPHGANLFTLVVGRSSDGRKGTLLGHARRFMKDADPFWTEQCVHAGLRTGEGIVKHFAPRLKKKTKSEESDEEEINELEIPDPRGMFIESEYGTTLRVAQREGCTLSPVLRQCYDRDTLEVMTKVDPLRADGTHISVIGQITPMELRKQLGATDLTNGYVNRFLLCLVQRTKLLPFGSSLPDADRAQLVGRLRGALNRARGVTRVDRDSEARALWAEAYPQLCSDSDAPMTSSMPSSHAVQHTSFASRSSSPCSTARTSYGLST